MSGSIKTPFGEIPFEVADLPKEAVFGLGKTQEVIQAAEWIKKLQSQLLAEQEKVKKLKEACELVDYQFAASFGDAEVMRSGVSKMRQILKEVEGV